MPQPFLLAQLTDFHIGADWGYGDPAPRLAAAVAAVVAARPDAVVVTGDLAENGADAEYALARELLEPLGTDVHVLPGNHDDRAALRRAFALPGAGAEPIRYSVALGPLRLIALDTTIPGRDPGALDGEQLDWLDAELALEPAAPALIALHHPPLRTGIAAWDAVGLDRAAAAALLEVAQRHPQVRRIAAGHVHRAIAAGPVLTVPSTYVQRLDFDVEGMALADEPAMFALHSLIDGELVSHLLPVR